MHCWCRQILWITVENSVTKYKIIFEKFEFLSGVQCFSTHKSLKSTHSLRISTNQTTAEQLDTEQHSGICFRPTSYSKLLNIHVYCSSITNHACLSLLTVCGGYLGRLLVLIILFTGQCSTSLQHQMQGSPCGRCSVPACSVLPPASDNLWYGDQVHRSMNSQLLLYTQTQIQWDSWDNDYSS